ncbi:MAG: efflux RND transporter periplasmic adaptor subunit [Deltaproteobacteria bacterium]|nr:efflux RND transporter periplasmic adaptor subunit [Candidatus Zymogenaceae bacterium]
MDLKPKRKYIYAAIGALIVVVLLLSFMLIVRPFSSTKNGDLSENAMENSSAVPVTVTEVRPGKIRNTLFYTAVLFAEDEVEVYGIADGKVIEYRFKEGDRVRRGDILVTLERQEMYDRYLPLNVRAPINGVVARNYLDTGELATTQTPLSLIVGSNKIKAIIHAPGADTGLIEVGMGAELVVPEMPREIHPGTVSEVSPVRDADTRTSRIEVLFENDGAELVSGMFGDIEIIIEEKSDVLTLPTSALLFEKSGREDPFCFVASDDDTARKRSLSLGIVTEDLVEVLSGLEAGEIVIIDGKENLEDGCAVLVIDTL